jgi:CBS-domain-containing membrane protein
MNNPDSAMALATEINNYLNPLYNIGREQLAAIIRKHRAQEIGELAEGLRYTSVMIRSVLKSSQCDIGPTDTQMLKDSVSKAEFLLSRYPKV